MPTTVADILGGQKVLRREIAGPFDLMELGSRGVSKTALVHLAEFLGRSMAEMAELLPVTQRTLQRYRPRDRFDRVVSEHILQLAEVAARGLEVFGDRDRFLAWLNEPSLALGRKSPVSLLGSRFGVQLLLDELGRIEHGVFS